MLKCSKICACSFFIQIASPILIPKSVKHLSLYVSNVSNVPPTVSAASTGADTVITSDAITLLELLGLH